MNGVTTLAYVRARHAELIGDFGRSQRQQQVLVQVKDKLRSADIDEYATLIQDLRSQVKTDLGFAGLLQRSAFRSGHRNLFDQALLYG